MECVGLNLNLCNLNLIMETEMKKQILVVGLVIAAMLFSGCDAILEPDEEFNAGEVIKETLKSPSSYRRLNGKVLWRGKNDFGNSFVVRIEYESQNSFGALIKDCQVVAYSNNGKQLNWNGRSALTSCKSVGDSVPMIEGFAKGNGLGVGKIEP